MPPMFSFHDAPQQEVSLPDGRRWTVRVERDDEPTWDGGMFTLNFWYTRWLFARLFRALKPASMRGWRVAVVADATVTSEQLALAQTAMLLTPSMGRPVVAYEFASREQAERWAVTVYDELRARGVLPTPT